MKKLFLLTLLISFIFCSVCLAAKMEVKYNGLSDIKYKYDNVNKTGYATEFGITLNYDDLEYFSTFGYCVDIHNDMLEKTYDVDLNIINVNSGNYLYAAWLMDSWGDEASTDKKFSAGLQIAIWDAVYGDLFENRTKGIIENKYLYYLSEKEQDSIMFSSLDYIYAITSYKDGVEAQNLIVRLDKVNPVPEPTTILLLGSGLGLLYLNSRRKIGICK